jgi:ABC-type histidine transport system ATPase subunit
MRPDIALIILAIIVAGIFSLHLIMGFMECITDNIIRLKQNGIFDDEGKTNKKEEIKEMNRNMNKIRENLKKRINHKNPWDKHVTILEEVETEYSVLKWKYDNNTVEARSKDVNLLYALQECIEMYLEETEEVKE